MTSPTIQGPNTAWVGYTRGRLRELCLRQTGVSDPGHVAPDSALPAATAEEVSVMDGFLGEALTEIATLLDRYTMLAETSVVADGDFTAVLLPADFGVICDNGVHVGGYPVRVLTTEEWLRTRRPASEGGGTTLTDVTGDIATSRLVARIVPAAPASASVAKRMALFLYPAQTAAWTADVVELSGDGRMAQPMAQPSMSHRRKMALHLLLPLHLQKSRKRRRLPLATCGSYGTKRRTGFCRSA